MALNKTQLKNRIVTEMVAAGADPSGQHSWVNKLAEAIANAVVDEIKTNALVTVSSGSSAGVYGVN